MEYGKPEIVACAEAVTSIQGTKNSYLPECIDPTVPPQTGRPPTRRTNNRTGVRN